MSSDAELADWVGSELRQSRMGIAVAQPAPHQSIFKYVSLHTKTSWKYFERMIEEFELVGTTSVGLNDPFEFSPAIFDDLRPSTIKSAIGKPEIFYKVHGEELPKFSDLEKYQNISLQYLESLRRNSRVISFCERSDSPLLWSHYANSYKGACIHFLASGFRQFDARLGYVGYSNHRPIYPLSLALRLAQGTGLYRPEDTSRAESAKFMFYTKAMEWAYEAELRIIYNSEKNSSIKFEPDSMASIIVGPRMSEEDFDRLNGALFNSPLSHVPVRRARLSENSFSVDVGGGTAI